MGWWFLGGGRGWCIGGKKGSELGCSRLGLDIKRAILCRESAADENRELHCHFPVSLSRCDPDQ